MIQLKLEGRNSQALLRLSIAFKHEVDITSLKVCIPNIVPIKYIDKIFKLFIQIKLTYGLITMIGSKYDILLLSSPYVLSFQEDTNFHTILIEFLLIFQFSSIMYLLASPEEIRFNEFMLFMKD